MNYPDKTGHNDAATSKKAVEELDAGGRNRQLDFCNAFLISKKLAGCTGEELKIAMNDAGFGNIERSQASARLSDLTAMDLAYSTQNTRTSSFSGKEQMVYIAKEYATPEDIYYHVKRKAERGNGTDNTQDGLKALDAALQRAPQIKHYFTEEELEIIRRDLGAKS